MGMNYHRIRQYEIFKGFSKKKLEISNTGKTIKK